MEPTLNSGDTVFIKQQPTVEDGEITAVLVDDNEEATLKRVKHMGKQILLMPDNTDYSPILLNKENPGRILGKVIESRRRF
ncbi:S24 family peptidase [Lactobacillus sp. ESL0785]|nr:S24 family peptidase [Lactobacillus sp. ESL0785]WEV71464.1 S24 family peptidase [Lactobacillus sp. ESL0785]